MVSSPWLEAGLASKSHRFMSGRLVDLFEVILDKSVQGHQKGPCHHLRLRNSRSVYSGIAGRTTLSGRESCWFTNKFAPISAQFKNRGLDHRPLPSGSALIRVAIQITLVVMHAYPGCDITQVDFACALQAVTSSQSVSRDGLFRRGPVELFATLVFHKLVFLLPGRCLMSTSASKNLEYLPDLS